MGKTDLIKVKDWEIIKSDFICIATVDNKDYVLSLFDSIGECIEQTKQEIRRQYREATNYKKSIKIIYYKKL